MSIRTILKYCCMLMLFSHIGSGFSQDLNNLPDSLYIKATGGITIGLNAYASQGMNSRRDPFSYLLNANLTFNISDAINMPFSATISSGSKTYTQPKFVILGASPKYKAVTLHAGYRNMQFSPYTLNGISFLGGGLEVAPEESFWKFKVLAGRFAKGIPFRDDVKGQVELPSYERWGWGGMLTLGNEKYATDLILFKASDDHRSITIHDSLDLAPKENLTFGINTRIKLFDNFSLAVEYARSAFTEDTRMEEVIYDRYTYMNNFGFLFTPRLSSSYSNAIGVNFGYSGNSFSLGIGYRRVDPDYKTLGSTYMSNDFRNITLNGSKSFLENRITLSGNYGVQKNNLEGDKEQTTNRVIAAIQGSFNINEKWNVSANYSNFSSESNPTYINLIDSIRFMQVSKSFGSVISYSTATEKLSHNVILNLNMQNSDMLNNSATEVTETNTLCNNALLSYNLSHQPWKISLNSSVNATFFESAGNTSKTIGPVFSLQRPFLERKMNSSLSYSRMVSLFKDYNNSTTVVRLNINYKILKSHTLKCSISSTFLNRKEPDEDAAEEETPERVTKKSSEIRFVLNYGYQF